MEPRMKGSFGVYYEFLSAKQLLCPWLAFSMVSFLLEHLSQFLCLLQNKGWLSCLCTSFFEQRKYFLLNKLLIISNFFTKFPNIIKLCLVCCTIEIIQHKLGFEDDPLLGINDIILKEQDDILKYIESLKPLLFGIGIVTDFIEYLIGVFQVGNVCFWLSSIEKLETFDELLHHLIFILR